MCRRNVPYIRHDHSPAKCRKDSIGNFSLAWKINVSTSQIRSTGHRKPCPTFRSPTSYQEKQIRLIFQQYISAYRTILGGRLWTLHGSTVHTMRTQPCRRHFLWVFSKKESAKRIPYEVGFRIFRTFVRPLSTYRNRHKNTSIQTHTVAVISNWKRKCNFRWPIHPQTSLAFLARPIIVVNTVELRCSPVFSS